MFKQYPVTMLQQAISAKFHLYPAGQGIIPPEIDFCSFLLSSFAPFKFFKLFIVNKVLVNNYIPIFLKTLGLCLSLFKINLIFKLYNPLYPDIVTIDRKENNTIYNVISFVPNSPHLCLQDIIIIKLTSLILV